MDNPDQMADIISAQKTHIPDWSRRFATAQDNLIGTGINTEQLEEFIKAGLPSCVKEGKLFVDAFDLSNLSLHLKLPSLQRMAMRSWCSALRQSHTADRVSVKLSYVLPGDAEWDETKHIRVFAPDGLTSVRTESRDLFQSDFELESETLLLPDDIALFINDTFKNIDFYMMTEVIRWDIENIERSGMAECGGASKLLALRAQEAGFEARQRFGFILAQPYASAHYWCEFKVDGVWRSADPLMIKILRHSLNLDVETWPLHRSPGAALLGLAVVVGYDAKTGRPLLDCIENEGLRLDPIVTQGERDIVASYPTEIAYLQNTQPSIPKSQEAI